jgi:hypothetical protein
MIQRIFLFVIALCLLACKEDETGPLLQFKTDSETYSLKDAKLYLKLEGSYEGAVNYTYRDYLISDGDLIEGENGWSMNDYTNATYFIAFELASADPNSVAAGDFPLHRFWDNVTDGSNLSYLFAGFDDKIVDTPDSNTKSIISLKGGLEPGETMTIEFDGEMAYRANGGALTPFAGKLSFTGKVIDKRD